MSLIPVFILHELLDEQYQPFNEQSDYQLGRSNSRKESPTRNPDKDRFKIWLDVQQFTPDEISVTALDNSIIIECKHEERRDRHGFISRQFTRRYVLSSEYNIQNAKSKLSSDGILTVTIPKEATGESKIEKNISITQTGPAKKKFFWKKGKAEVVKLSKI